MQLSFDWTSSAGKGKCVSRATWVQGWCTSQCPSASLEAAESHPCSAQSVTTHSLHNTRLHLLRTLQHNVMVKMVNGSRFYRALESVSIASALSTALTIYPCQIRVHKRWQSKLQLLTAQKQWRRQNFSLGAASRRRRHRGGWGAENFWFFNLEMAHFDAHLRYSDGLILRFCIAT